MKFTGFNSHLSGPLATRLPSAADSLAGQRFVSGHLFSDAVIAPQSVTPSGAAVTGIPRSRCAKIRAPKYLALLLLATLFATTLFAQTPTGTLRGKVTDPSGAVISGATVTATAAGGQKSTATTNDQGVYEFKNLPSGSYIIDVDAKGFTTDHEVDVAVEPAKVQPFDIVLSIQVQQEQVSVQAQTSGVQVNPDENSSAIVIKGKDLEALSDDPDELQSELDALAGPSAGHNGGQVYIDGFTGGQLPPKSAIREIHVNQNPFSAQYDKLGYGRIEILTKPGADKLHGQFFFNDSDSALNSRNPFVNTQPSYQSEIFDGNLGGPLGKKASFFIDAQRRNIHDLDIINAVVPDATFTSPNGVPFTDAIPDSNTRTNISPRIDYQLTKTNTLTVRYQFEQSKQNNQGIGQTSLASQALSETETENTLQISDSQTLGVHVVNDLRFQFILDRDNVRAQNTTPATQVLGFFTSGGNSQGTNLDDTRHYELQNYTYVSHGKHYIRFGGRLRVGDDSNFSSSAFNGVFTFPSLAAYNVTEAGLQMGLTPAQSRAACLALSANPASAQCGASQLSLVTGQPQIQNTIADVGFFAEDEWRIRPNITANYGLRFETQNEIHDHADFAPRVGIAWGLGGKNGNPKTVVRAGAGMFYDRFTQQYVLQAQRLNGTTQQQTIVTSPDCYPTPANCSGGTVASTIYQINPKLRAPYTIQSAASVERQISRGASVSVTYLNSIGNHQFLSDNINAPLPGCDPATPVTCVRPSPALGNIYQYQSEGVFRQNQMIASARFSVGRKVSLFGFYMLNSAKSNTSGAGSFPTNQYDLAQDYGRSGFAVRQRAFIGGSISLPYSFSLAPFIVANSGQPFNITLGQDLNGDSIFNDRPALVSNTTCSQSTVSGTTVCSPWGTFSTVSSGPTIVPVNYGTGPTQVTVNLRLAKTFGFGPETGGRSGGGGQGGGPGGGPGGPGGGGRGGPPGGGLGPGGLGGGGGGGNPFGGGSTNRRYNLTFSISARNLFNSQNLSVPVGDVNSSRFGQSIALAGGIFGGSAAANRRLDLQVRFSF